MRCNNDLVLYDSNKCIHAHTPYGVKLHNQSEPSVGQPIATHDVYTYWGTQLATFISYYKATMT